MEKRIKLSTKIIRSFMSIALIVLLVGLVGWFSLSTISSHFDEVVDVRLPSIISLENISEQQTAIKAATRSLLISDLPLDKINGQYLDIEDARDHIKEAWDIYIPLPQSKDEEALWNIFVLKWENWTKDIDNLIILSKKYWNNPTEEIYSEFLNYELKHADASFRDAESSLINIIILNEEISIESKNEADHATSLMYIFVIIAMLIGTISATILGIFLSNSITKPILKSVSELSNATDQFLSASSQLSEGSQSLAQGNSEQAAAVEEISATIDESTSMIKQGSENSIQVSSLSTQATIIAKEATEHMVAMAAATNDIKKSSDEISKIIKVIDEIAFQTNILALNAAVEAARAGDAGAGFAVVAEEVRNLAARSAQAAKDTSEIIEVNIDFAEKGIVASDKVHEGIISVSALIDKVNQLANEVAAASEEQSQGISQINIAMNQMGVVTQQNAAVAEETASASEELNAQSEFLKEITTFLTKLINGTNELRQPKSISKKKVKTTILNSKDKQISKISSSKKSKEKNANDPEVIIPFDETDDF